MLFIFDSEITIIWVIFCVKVSANKVFELCIKPKSDIANSILNYQIVSAYILGQVCVIVVICAFIMMRGSFNKSFFLACTLGKGSDYVIIC